MEKLIFPRQASSLRRIQGEGTRSFLRCVAQPRNSERKALIDWLRRLRFLKRINKRRRIRFSRILSDPFSSCSPRSFLPLPPPPSLPAGFLVVFPALWRQRRGLRFSDPHLVTVLADTNDEQGMTGCWEPAGDRGLEIRREWAEGFC